MSESKEKTKKTTKKSAKKDELLELTVEYRNKMAEEKYRKLKVGNDKEELDLTQRLESICYKSVAIKAFESAISSIYARIKNADEQLTARLQLNVQQADILHDYMEDILNDLSNIDIQLDSTEVFDAKNYLAGSARKRQMLNTNSN